MVHEEWLRNELQILKQNGIGAAEILIHREGGICDVCLEEYFTKPPIDDSTEKQPLSHDNCTCTEDAAADCDPPCDCTYLPAYADDVPS